MRIIPRNSFGPDVQFFVLKGQLAFDDESELTTQLLALVTGHNPRIVLDIRETVQFGNDQATALLTAVRKLITASGTSSRIHLLPSEEGSHALKRMHLDDYDGVGPCFGSENEAIEAFREWPRQTRVN